MPEQRKGDHLSTVPREPTPANQLGLTSTGIHPRKGTILPLPDQYATTFQSYRVRTRLIPGSSYDWQKHPTI